MAVQATISGGFMRFTIFSKKAYERDNENLSFGGDVGLGLAKTSKHVIIHCVEIFARKDRQPHSSMAQSAARVAVNH